MIYLLDASVLIPLLIKGHVHHDAAAAWADGKATALCPISELAFLRTAVRAYKSEQKEARKTLQDFRTGDRPVFIPDNLSPLAASPFPSAAKSTDWYLSELAASHGMKLATFDGGIEHPAAEIIPSKHPAGE